MTVYSSDGNICLKHGSEKPVQLGQAGVITSLEVSDDQSMFAFVKTRIVDEESKSIRLDELWVADADGGRMRLLLSSDDIATLPGDAQRHPFIEDFQWLPGRHQLVLTNSYSTTTYEFSAANADLMIVDANTDTHATLLNPGDGGVKFHPSPDGELIAVIRGSDFGSGRDAVGVIKSDGTEWRARIFTYSSRICHCGDRPDNFAVPVWKSGSTGFWIAAPPADERKGDQTATTWYVPADGSPVQQLGEIGPIKLSGPDSHLTFSPDGMWVAYEGTRINAARPAVHSDTGLHFVRPNGSVDITYFGTDRPVHFDGWEPDSRGFHFQVLSTSWRGRIGSSYEETPSPTPPDEGCSPP